MTIERQRRCDQLWRPQLAAEIERAQHRRQTDDDEKQRYNVVPFAERRWHLAELEARREAIVADPARAAELRGVDFRLNGARSCLELEGWPELTHEDLVKAIAQLRNQVAELRARNSELDAALDEFLLED